VGKGTVILMTTAVSVFGDYGARTDLVRYLHPSGAEHIVYGRRVRGAVRVMDQVVGGHLADRRHVVATGLYQLADLKSVVAAWLAKQGGDVLSVAEVLT
jgi:predicted aconitase with swiveling domain